MANNINSCLSGCIGSFKRGPFSIEENIGLQGESVTPIVEVVFSRKGGGEAKITVGNKSAPQFGHEAVIKSFEYGTSNGATCKLEILDEQGGSFHAFVDSIIKCLGTSSSGENQMTVRYGWSTEICSINSTENFNTKRVQWSSKVNFVPLDMQVNFEGGKVKFIVTATDTMQVAFVGRESKIWGDDENPLPLKEAIIKLFSDNEPKAKVKFLKRAGGTWEFEGDPVCKWQADNQNKLSVVQKWIEPFLTKDKKGIRITYDTSEKIPTLIFWEDPLPRCNESSLSSSSIGTFIVNGGKCSDVISFSPTINWAAAFAKLSVAGNSGGSTTGEPTNQNDPEAAGPCKKPQTPQTGIQQSIPVSEPGNCVHGEDAVKKTAQSQKAHSKANSFMTDGLQAIEAELKIVGNPLEKFSDIKILVGTTASIVVINPFHLKGSGSLPQMINGKNEGSCGDWLADPQCNRVLTNRAWIVISVNHAIKEGSFITTLKLVLPVPGIDLPAGAPVGGAGSGDYTPETC